MKTAAVVTTANGISVGCNIRKYFEGHGTFDGVVVSIDTAEHPTLYRVRFADGDEEDYDEVGIKPLLLSSAGAWKRKQEYIEAATAAAAASNGPEAAEGSDTLRNAVFASETVERAMRRVTVQTASTDEPQLDTLLEIPVYTKAAQAVQLGIAAFASRNLRKGELIGEYAGKIVCDADLQAAPRSVDAYAFDLGDGFAVDASKMGNQTRRMNHSAAKPNVRAVVLNVRSVRRVGMYAICDVKIDSELLFDYGDQYDWKGQLVKDGHRDGVQRGGKYSKLLREGGVSFAHGGFSTGRSAMRSRGRWHTDTIQIMG